MPPSDVDRRSLLLIAGVSAGAASVPAAGAAQAPPAPSRDAPAGYVFFKPAEAAFIEAVVNHMIPADELTPSGVDLGIAVFIDRALAGGWGKGERLYLEGPWSPGTPNQGYQLALTPSELFRAGVAQSNAWCKKTYGKAFERLPAADKEAVLKALSAGSAAWPSSLPPKAFFDVLYQTVMEGFFADPVYGGNRGKASWRMLGFPGVLANNARNISAYNNGQRFPADPVGIADMS